MVAFSVAYLNPRVKEQRLSTDESDEDDDDFAEEQFREQRRGQGGHTGINRRRRPGRLEESWRAVEFKDLDAPHKKINSMLRLFL